MASSTTINAWLGELAQLVVPQSSPQRTKRRQIDGFCRRVKTHTFLQTNQFEVSARLDGLKEKFQILDRDDLSDALHERLLELRGHDLQWIPDVLDLLLRLSYDPVNKTRLIDSSSASQTNLKSPPPTSDGFGTDGDSDLDEQIWAIPVFSDLSSEEEETEVSETASVPSVNVDTHPADKSRVQYDSTHIWDSNREIAEVPLLLKSLVRDSISEVQIAREVLLMIQGFPTTIFIADKRKNLSLKYSVTLGEVSSPVLLSLLDRGLALRKVVETLKAWIDKQVAVDYVQIVQHGAGRFLNSYTASISEMLGGMLQPKPSTTVSLFNIISRMDANAESLRVLDVFIQQSRHLDPVACLDCLYELVGQFDLCGNHVGTETLLSLFIDAFDVYLRPIKPWLTHGKLDDNLQPFFVRVRSERSTMSNLWHDWYEVELVGPQRPTDFMLPFAKEIFACGKTSLFLRQISRDCAEDLTELDDLVHAVRSAASIPTLPFTAAFCTLLSNCFASLLSRRTAALKDALNNVCGLSRSLDAFDLIYLRKNGMLVDKLESIIFSRMDRCLDNWNDRFLVADSLEDVYASVRTIDMDSILVHSAHTSSRNMESRRRSVKTLASLAIEYVLPWPIANIISKESLAAYWRIALHLTQIRRAKYALERIAYVNVNANPISDNPADQKRAQIWTFVLINFTNNLYDHFTSTVIMPPTTRMREELHAAKSVDDMISVHQTYMDRLETACLTNKSLKLLRDTLIGLLDMCIRFADLMSSPSLSATGPAVRRTSDDFEASSFKSAQSLYHRRHRRRQRYRNTSHGPPTDEAPSSSSTEDDDDNEDEDNEGYSSFIVLDEDTTVVKEINKLQTQFQRQLEFFIAGIKGVGRTGKGELVEAMDMLADRLTWKRQKRNVVD